MTSRVTRTSTSRRLIAVALAAILVPVFVSTAASGAGEHVAAPARAAVPAVLLIGDSVMAGMAQSYGAEARATLAARHSFILEAAGCRRLISTSCRIGSSPAPPHAMTVLVTRAYQFNRVLVVAAGYNDSATGATGVDTAVDRLIAEARRQGIARVVWLTYREAGTSSHVAQYRASNFVLRAKDAEYPELYLADWAARSRNLPSSWFSSDGLHLGKDAAIAMAELIADTLDVALFGAPPPVDPPPTTSPPPASSAPAATTATTTTPPPPTRCTSTTVSGIAPPSLAPATDAAPTGGVHVLSPPVRLLDTRDLPGKLGAGRMIEVPVAGSHGVPADAAAAIVTVTTVEPCAAGFVTAFPCGSGVPTTAVLNAPANSIVANSAVVRLGNGAMCVYSNQRSDVVVDLTGWVGPGGAATTVVTPTRIVDTRPGESQALPGAQQRLPGGWVMAVDVASLPGVGPSATAVTFNLVAANPSAAGFLTVLPGPCATLSLPPTTAALTVTAHRDVAASATVATGGGQICVYSSVETDVVIDLQGVHGPSGRGVTTISPQRLIDTRPGGRLAAGAVMELDLDLLMPHVPAGLTGAIVNLTGVDPASNGYLVVFACGLPQRPFVSNLNVGSITVANRALVSTEGGRRLCVFTTVETDVVIDVQAWIV